MALVAQQAQLLERAFVDAADDDAGRIRVAAGERLTLDIGDGVGDACDGLEALGDLVVVVKRLVDGLDDEVAVDAEDLAQQFAAEAVHDAHHDDQGRDAEGHADQGQHGDDGDEALLAPGTQIAPGEEEFEAGERTRSPRCGG